MAAFIFCKAYIAIFKEHLLSESNSFREGMGKDEQILNSQLVKTESMILFFPYTQIHKYTGN